MKPFAKAVLVELAKGYLEALRGLWDYKYQFANFTRTVLVKGFLRVEL